MSTLAENMQMMYNQKKGERPMYSIRTATFPDLPEILKIYANARAFMASRGNPSQWGTTNPPKAQLEQDIHMQRLFVICKDQTIHGVFYFWIGEDPTYGYIEGQWSSDRLYGTIHRIASDGYGGIVKAAVSFCSEKCQYLRIDTHADNLPMQAAIQRAGFQRCGTIYIADGSARIAYDRI